MKTKCCARCKCVKSHEEFAKHKNKKDGISSYCTPCANILSQEYKDRHRGRVRRNEKFRQAKKKYNLSKENYYKILENQEYKCPICLRELDPFDGTTNCHIDHCHKTGIVRGILCFNCNTSIGKLGDDEEMLERAIQYLQSTKEYS